MSVKTHNETRLLPYTADQMFDLVADVARYPEFLPWCMGARIREVEQGPRGEVYLLEDGNGGRLLRLEPVQTRR